MIDLVTAAHIDSGGRQFKITINDLIVVNKLQSADIGENIFLEKVLAMFIVIITCARICGGVCVCCVKNACPVCSYCLICPVVWFVFPKIRQVGLF